MGAGVWAAGTSIWVGTGAQSVGQCGCSLHWSRIDAEDQDEQRPPHFLQETWHPLIMK